MTAFDFSTSGRIIFGRGSAGELKRIVADHSRILLVQGPNSANARHIEDLLLSLDCKIQNFVIPSEPTIELVQQGTTLARGINIQWVIGVGGGSVLDASKAIAGMATNPGEILDYLEVVGKGMVLKNPALPLIVLPTTAGTGSEVTRNAVITVPEKKFKASLRSPFLLPQFAIVDPELTLSLPAVVTASTGIDALVQLLEPFVSIRANALTDLFCVDGLQRIGKALPAAFKNGTDLAARTEMAYASLLGGLALANSGLGAVHGFASPIGGMFPAPHGAVCACLLAPVIKANVTALRQRKPGSPILEKYRTAVRLLTHHSGAEIEDGLAWLVDLVTQLEIQPLHSFGIARADIPQIVAGATAASSMKGNPIVLTPEELTQILTEAF